MQHPDEGTIHAWLDGALPPGEASALEAHVASCAECSAAVAAARGMLAAASRILSALDDVPGGVIPAAAAVDATRVTPRLGSAAEMRRFRYRAARWQVAAGLMVAVAGSWLVLRQDGARDAIEIEAADTSVADQASVAFVPDTLAAGPAMVAEGGPQSQPPEPEQAGAVERMAARLAAPRASVPGSPREARPGSRTDAGSSASIGTAFGTGSGSGTGAVAGDVAATLRRAEVTSGKAVPGFGQGGQAARTGALTSAMFDSLLAIDSALTARRAVQLSANVVVAEERMGRAGAATARRVAPSAAPPPTAPPAPAATADLAVATIRQGSVPIAVAAAGCYALNAVRWSPLPADSAAPSVLPQRFVLERPSGSPADSTGPWVARPVASDNGTASGASGSWSLLGTKQLRVRFDRGEQRAVLTLARSIGGWSGVARLWPVAEGPTSRGEVSARRIACEPPDPER